MNEAIKAKINEMKETFIPMYVEATKAMIADNYSTKSMKKVDTTIPNKIKKEAKNYSNAVFAMTNVYVDWDDIFTKVYNACVKEANKINR